LLFLLLFFVACLFALLVIAEREKEIFAQLFFGVVSPTEGIAATWKLIDFTLPPTRYRKVVGHKSQPTHKRQSTK